VKKSLIVEADGGPLGITVAGANVPDAQLLDATIRAIVLQRPPVEEGYDQHLAMDKGYDNDTGYGACLDHEYVPHIALKRARATTTIARAHITALGGGTDVGVAVDVPGHSRPLGEEEHKLSRHAQTGLWAALVPAIPPTRRSEIDS